MNNYRRPIRRNRFRESLSWAERINFKSKGLEIFYIDTLTRMGANPNDPDDFSYWIKTGHLIDATSISDRDAIYFAKLNIYVQMTNYNNLDKVAATQKWDDEGISTLTDLCDLNDDYDEFKHQYLRQNNWDYNNADGYDADYIFDQVDDEMKEIWADEMRTHEYGSPWIEINSGYSGDFGMVGCGMNGDGFEFKFDITRLLPHVKLNYTAMDTLFNSLLKESYKRKGSRLY